MALQTSGAISLSDLHAEVGGSSYFEVSFNDADIRGLNPATGKTINSTLNTEIDFNDFYGASATPPSTTWTFNPNSANLANGYYYTTRITVSDFVSSGFVSGDTLKIQSNTYVQANSYFVAALIVDMPCTIINEGRIVGKGTGGGGSYSTGPQNYIGETYQYPTGVAAGPAIDVQSTGVTIVNQSGAYIAAGGGGGGVGWTSSTSNAGGGGGAGSGNGGQGSAPGTAGNNLGGTNSALGGTGGNTNDYGNRGRNISGYLYGGYGGGAGGGGASISASTPLGGGGGGMELPGLGGSGSTGTQFGGTTTGKGGNADGAGQGIGNGVTNTSGGGGGWGATGGTGQGGYPGGLGGPAIKGTARTVTNNGTIYGST